MTTRAVTFFPLVALSALALTAATPAPRFDDGYQLTMKITQDPPQQGPDGATFKVAGDKMRIEMDLSSLMGGGRGGGGGGMAGFAAGAYILGQAGGKVAMIVPSSPMGAMGILLDGSALFGGGGGGGRGRGGMGGPAPAFTDVSVTVDDLGAGESIVGHPTHKYRLHRKYALNGAPHDESEELWMTTDFNGADQSFARLGSMFGQGGGELGDAVLAKMPKGVPLKIVSTSAGRAGPSTSTIEVTDIKKATFDAADFEVPAGMQLMDLGAMMGGRRGGGHE